MPVTYDFSKAPSEMNNREKRAKIARKTGHRPASGRLPKDVWNSLHAWFTGEFHTMPTRPGVPDRGRLIVETVAEVRSAYEPTDFALTEYQREVTPVWVKAGKMPRPLNSTELEALLEALEAVEDRRRWTG